MNNCRASGEKTKIEGTEQGSQGSSGTSAKLQDEEI